MQGRRRPRRLVPPVMLAARELRTHQTPAEDKLWVAPGAQKLGGMRFRRRHPVGPFILDFYCPEKKPCIEVDGSVHDSQRGRMRSALEIRVIRFRNDEVLNELPSVVDRITAAPETS